MEAPVREEKGQEIASARQHLSPGMLAGCYVLAKIADLENPAGDLFIFVGRFCLLFLHWSIKFPVGKWHNSFGVISRYETVQR